MLVVVALMLGRVTSFVAQNPAGVRRDLSQRAKRMPKRIPPQPVTFEQMRSLNMTEDILRYNVDGETRALRTAERLAGIPGLNNLDILERSPALVLNSDYQPLSYAPLSVWNWQDAAKAVFNGKVTVVAEYTECVIRSANSVMAVPSVIALKGFQKRNLHKHPHFTRRNVYIRDFFRCQYCHNQFRPSALTYDHVVPRCQGGGTSWDNVVTACTVCNCNKGNLPLAVFQKKYQVKLKRPPQAPSHEELISKARRLPLYRNYHDSWGAYMSDYV